MRPLGVFIFKFGKFASKGMKFFLCIEMKIFIDLLDFTENCWCLHAYVLLIEKDFKKFLFS